MSSLSCVRMSCSPQAIASAACSCTSVCRAGDRDWNLASFIIRKSPPRRWPVSMMWFWASWDFHLMDGWKHGIHI